MSGASLRAPGTTAAGGIDAFWFPRLTSARPYEHRSIYRTTHFVGWGVGYTEASFGRAVGGTPHGATAVRTWRRRPGRLPMTSPYAEGCWASTREKRRRRTGAAGERDAPAAHAKSRHAGAERSTRPSRRTAPTRSPRRSAPAHRRHTATRIQPAPSASGGSRSCPASTETELPPANPIWALFAR
jgi:hypothetical protein